MFNQIIISAVIIAILAGGGFLYFRWSQSQLAELNKQVEFYSQKVEQLQSSLDATYDHIDRMQSRMNNLNTNMRNISQQTSELRKVLAKHDLEKLAAKKPGLIQNRANEATKELFNELEAISRD